MKWVRAVAAAILGVIAVVGLVASVVGLWARDTVFDESEVGGAVEAAIEEPGVTDALAARLADNVMTAVDLETRLNNILPPPLQPITPAIVGGTTQLLEDRLTNRFADPDTRNLLVNTFERSYAAFLDVMEGDGLVDGVTVAHGEVTVNFLPLIADGLQQLQRFRLLDDATIPELDRQGDPSEQIAQLEDGLGRDLPDEFGQVVVYRSDSLAAKGETLERAQQALILIKRAFVWILVVTVVAIVGTLLVARKRMRATFALLLGSAATFVVVRAVVKKVLDDIPSVARTAAGQAALAAATSSLAESLVKALGVLAVLFLVGAIVVYMLDVNSALRRRLAARSGSPTLGAAVAAYRVPVALGAAAGALLVITIGGFSVLALIVALLLVLLAMFALWAPDPPAADAVPPAPSADDTIS